MSLSQPAAAMPTGSGDGAASTLRVLLVAFSARYALGQLLDEMFNALSRRIDCRVLAPSNYSGLTPERYLMRAPCGVSKIGGMAASLNPAAHWKAVSVIWRAKPDVIHILSGEGYTWAVSLAVAARLIGIPVLVTLHDPEPHPGNVIEHLNALVRRPVLALARAVHVFSAQHIDRVRKLAGRARLAIIAHGSLAGQFLRHRKHGVEREELVLFFGRIQRYKGIDILLQAMSELPATTRLAIAGPGTLEPSVRRRMGALGNRVELHNKYLDDAEVATLMQRASVVALPYTHATQSSVPAIAAAFGCRVVASALGHFIEEVPQLGGLLVPSCHPAALAAALADGLAAERLTPITPPSFEDLAESFVTLYQWCKRPTLASDPAEQGRVLWM